MIAAAFRETETEEMRAGQLIVYVADDAIDDAAIAAAKHSHPSALVFADLIDPLYDPSIPTRQAAHTLGRIKSELESMVKDGSRVVVLCHRRNNDLGTRSHFLSSLC